MSILRRPGMSTGLNRPPILSQSYRNSADTVKYPLVMRCCTVGIGISKSICFDHSLRDYLAAETVGDQLIEFQRKMSVRQPFVGKIGKDAEVDPSTSDLLNHGSDSFT
ncbi:hypothetical protein BMS3Bbin04_00995 [bacterium BMS3Bbin04]|nr:hypothetical protein BMS3Bbin04_00995 [bacterium BMS3Bbin04]